MLGGNEYGEKKLLIVKQIMDSIKEMESNDIKYFRSISNGYNFEMKKVKNYKKNNNEFLDEAKK